MASPALSSVATAVAAMPGAPATGHCGGGISAVKCQLTKKVTDAAGDAVAHASKSVMGQIADSLKDAANALLKGLMTFWMNVDTPTFEPGGTQADLEREARNHCTTGWGLNRSCVDSWIDAHASPLQTIHLNIGWLVIALAVASLVIGACQLVIRQKGQPLQAIAVGLGRLVLVCALSTWAVQQLGQLSDAVSTALLRNAHIGTAAWSKFINLDAIVAAFAYKPAVDGLLMIFSLLVIIASLVQMLLMVLRVGLLTILTGILPLSAAAAINGDWSDTWKKTLGWLVAWLVYKPAAALLIASAFALTRGKTLTEVLSGLMLLLLSVLLLPALLRLIAPMTAALGASGGGQMAMAATAGLASGAVRLGAGAATAGVGAAATSGLGGSRPSGNGGVAGAGMQTAEQAIDGGGTSPNGSGGTGAGTGQPMQQPTRPGPAPSPGAGAGSGPQPGGGADPSGSGSPPQPPPSSDGPPPSQPSSQPSSQLTPRQGSVWQRLYDSSGPSGGKP